MRVRRWRIWKLGSRDFRGLDYVNQKTAKPAGAGGLGGLLVDVIQPAEVAGPELPDSPPPHAHGRILDPGVVEPPPDHPLEERLPHAPEPPHPLRIRGRQ